MSLAISGLNSSTSFGRTTNKDSNEDSFLGLVNANIKPSVKLQHMKRDDSFDSFSKIKSGYTTDSPVLGQKMR